MTNPSPVTSAVTPAQLASVYGIAPGSTGAGTTIAIVDAYNDPNIQADLQVFDAQYGLPAASLTVLNQNNGASLPPSDPGWSLEIAMDVEWAHAAAPGAKLVLVEANSTNTTDLMAAVATAANRSNVVSMSWGGSEFAGQSQYDTPQYFGRTGVTFVAASGDDGGASGAEWPASSPDVVAVGGTTLSANGTETAWSSSGSNRRGYSGSAGGVSTQYPLPSFQATALGKSYASGRVTPDVALDGNPNTGFSVYDSVPGDGSTGWSQVGGTSAGTPVWAAVVAAADQARGSKLGSLSSTQTLNLLYGLYGTTSKPAATYASAFRDITSGSNFAGSALTGFDRVTGLGTPKVAAIAAAAANYGSLSASAVTTTAAARSPLALLGRVTTRDVTFVVTVTAPTTAGGAPTVSVVAVVTPPPPLAPPVLPLRPPVVDASAAATPLSPPAQSTSRPEAAFALSDAEGKPSGPALRQVPGLFLDPVDPPSVTQEGPALAGSDGPSGLRLWDEAVVLHVAEDSSPYETDPAPAAVPAVETDEADGSDESSPGLRPAAAAGVALALWGVSEFRTRRSDRPRRRGALVLGQPFPTR